jgi:ubiquinone/menaquinone biosynthesis C-methylase UbiE
LHAKFPHADFRRLGRGHEIDILVAGCGTGQQSIEVAQEFPKARIVAFDLSLASLGYARRKSRELGLANIEYAQADLLELGGIGRSFDLIEASGVLHHLADPLAGWRMLLTLLRPGGVMNVGLYSEVARRRIVAAREHIAARGYRPTAEDIRAFRMEAMQSDAGAPLRWLADSGDFYSISDCRDLLFHVQEHRFTLPQIGQFLDDNALTLIGFDIDAAVRHRYAAQFPHDRTLTDLDSWHRFEAENPDTFLGMYQFWLQK